jgi:hypothetical protein
MGVGRRPTPILAKAHLHMSDDLSVPSRSDNVDQFRQFLVGSGGPAFLRRTSQVTGAYEQLLDACRKQRHELLSMVDLRLATLLALAGSWEAIRPLVVSEAQLEALKSLHAERNPRLRHEVRSVDSSTKLQNALLELAESIKNFNRRWLEYLNSVDCTPINRLREDFNRYYVLEKECAVRSVSVATQGFRPLEMLSIEHLRELFPALTIPELPPSTSKS